MQFRLHRGSLEESMKTLIEVKSYDELHDAIIVGLLPQEITVEKLMHDLYFEYYHKDDRIGWSHCYLVGIRDCGIIGFADKPSISLHPMHQDKPLLLSTEELMLPIESAPKDGTFIYVVDPDTRILYKASWDPGGDSFINGKLEITGNWSVEADGDIPGGWFEPCEVSHYQLTSI